LADAFRLARNPCETRQKCYPKNRSAAAAANLAGPIERPGVVGDACSRRPRTDETCHKLIRAEQLLTPSIPLPSIPRKQLQHQSLKNNNLAAKLGEQKLWLDGEVLPHDAGRLVRLPSSR
jgi:hypothetical protein